MDFSYLFIYSSTFFSTCWSNFLNLHRSPCGKTWSVSWRQANFTVRPIAAERLSMQFAAPKWIQVSFPRNFKLLRFIKQQTCDKTHTTSKHWLKLEENDKIVESERENHWKPWKWRKLEENEPKIKMLSPMESCGWHILFWDDSLFAVSTNMNFRNDKRGKNKTPKTPKNVFSMVLQISFQVCVSVKWLYLKGTVTTIAGTQFPLPWEKRFSAFDLWFQQRYPRFFGCRTLFFNHSKETSAPAARSFSARA